MKLKIETILDRPFTLRNLLYLLSFSSIVCLVFMLHFQNQQILELIRQIEELQKQFHIIQKNITDLNNISSAKDIEIHRLKSSIDALKAASIAIDTVSQNDLIQDPELIRAYTERRQFYFKLAGAVALLGLGIWAFQWTGSLFSIKSWLPNKVLLFSHKLGFFNESLTLEALKKAFVGRSKLQILKLSLPIFLLM